MSALTKREEFSIHDIDSKKDLLKRTICKGVSDEEFELFLHACKRTGLDPFMKQLYGVPRWDGKLQKNVMSIQTSIDGFRLIAERSGRYSPGKEPIYAYNEGKLLSATAYIKKQTPDGTWHEISATAFWDEYVQLTKDGRPTQFWNKMPHLMLAKCAEALAIRKAFPAELSGIYTQEEMMQSTNGNEAIVINTSTEAADSPLFIEEQRSEEEIEQKFMEIMQEAPEKEKLPEYLDICSKKGKKPVKKIMEDGIENSQKFLGFYRQWLAINANRAATLV